MESVEVWMEPRWCESCDRVTRHRMRVEGDGEVLTTMCRECTRVVTTGDHEGSDKDGNA